MSRVRDSRRGDVLISPHDLPHLTEAVCQRVSYQEDGECGQGNKATRVWVLVLDSPTSLDALSLLDSQRPSIPQ